MVKIVPFEASHLWAMDVQGHQALVRPLLNDPAYVDTLTQGIAYSAVDGQTCLACAGLIVIWPGRAYAWTLIGGNLKEYFPLAFRQVHRAIVGYLAECNIRRIECAVQDGFEPGHRWMRLLGFKRETPIPMRAYMPDGADAVLYARVRAD